jgi:hypothetical protein
MKSLTNNWFKKKSVEGLSLEQIYAGIPFKNEKARVTKVSDGTVLDIPLRKPTGGWKVLAFVMPLAHEHRIFLDKIGSLIYGRINGITDVEQMIHEFASAHKLGLIESRELVINFLKKLLKRGAIVIALEEK